MLPKPAWAWEFLRRNPTYIRDCCTTCVTPSNVRSAGRNARYLRLRRRCARAEAWGCIAFADPGLNGLEVAVFWRPDHHPAVVSARIAKSDRGRL